MERLVTNYCKNCKELADRNHELLEALKEITEHVNSWCAAIVINGSDWDSWDEYYKDACYTDSSRPNLLGKMRDIIAKG